MGIYRPPVLDAPPALARCTLGAETLIPEGA